jgi:1,4-alpha-glucan branching enzyme
MAVTLLTAACASRLREGIRVTPGGIQFRVKRAGAVSLAIAGDFNDWSITSHPLTHRDGFWTGLISLPPGEYLFMYVVDGHSWTTPEHAAELVPDGFGGLNGRLVVP